MQREAPPAFGPAGLLRAAHHFAKTRTPPECISLRSCHGGGVPGTLMLFLPALNEGSAWKTHACARRFLTERPASVYIQGVSAGDVVALKICPRTSPSVPMTS
jgi:hypothetical protein